MKVLFRQILIGSYFYFEGIKYIRTRCWSHEQYNASIADDRDDIPMFRRFNLDDEVTK